MSQMTFDGQPPTGMKRPKGPVARPANANGDSAWLGEAERRIAQALGADRAGGKFVKKADGPTTSDLTEIVTALLDRDRIAAHEDMIKAKKAHAQAVEIYSTSQSASDEAFDAWDKVVARKFLPDDHQYRDAKAHAEKLASNVLKALFHMFRTEDYVAAAVAKCDTLFTDSELARRESLARSHEEWWRTRR